MQLLQQTTKLFELKITICATEKALINDNTSTSNLSNLSNLVELLPAGKKSTNEF
jgi:hypothetical protein